MKPAVYIHAGLHKTGTTSIQWALTKSRSSLAESGVLFPHAGVPQNAPFGQHLLAWSVIARPNYVPVFDQQRALLSAQDKERLWEDLRAEIANAGHTKTILSSEEFDVLNAEEIADLGARLNGFDVYPVLVLRNYADFLESSYRTAVVHSGCRASADEFAGNQRTRLDFAQLVRDWSSIAAKDGVAVLNYDDPHVRRDSVGSFLEAVGLEPAIIGPQARTNQNESVSAYVCELARFLRLKGVDEKSIAIWIRRISKMPADQTGAARYSNLSTELRASLNARYEEELRRLRTDPDLTPYLKGTWTSPPAREVSPIRHAVDALLALGWAVETRLPD